MREAGITLALFALMLSGGCAAERESCPVPQAPEEAREPVELAADAVPPADSDAAALPASEPTPTAGAGIGQPAETAQNGVDDPETGSAAESRPQDPPRVDLVYFHTANPCGCLAEVSEVIESALQTGFPEEMEQKTVRLFSVVSDDPANAHLVRMYGSQQFDLFLVTYEGGTARATQVPEIWSLLGDNEAIALAVEARVTESLAVSARLD